MADRRTRDQLRASNTRLRAAIRLFVDVQERWLDVSGTKVLPADWSAAYSAMKELMADVQSGEPK